MTISTMNKMGQAVPVKLWTPIGEVEPQALGQLEKIASLPWVFHHVAAMPDVHFGKGATVGSVIAMKNALAPAAVGVDIGCGMGVIKTSLSASDLPESLEAIRAAIEATIPVGFNAHEEPAFRGHTPEGIKLQGSRLFDEFAGLTDKAQDLLGIARRQVGTLGGGNHFIEICLDDGKCTTCEGDGSIDMGMGFMKCGDCSEGVREPHVWLMLHSGSRHIGNKLAEYHIRVAKQLIHNQDIPDRDMAVFLAGTPEMAAYRNDLFWAQRYAFFNRRVMFVLLKQVMLQFFPDIAFEEPILCHHNYVSEEKHFGEDVLLTRKGAISAKRGELGVIPGSMGARSFVVRGLGNPDSFCSASHGAGRKMSRTEAKKRFTVDDVAKQTAGVCCRKDAAVIEEIPEAYKDIEQVMRNQADLVEVVATLKQVLCVKGN